MRLAEIQQRPGSRSAFAIQNHGSRHDLLRLRKYDLAIGQYRKAIELDPSFYQAYDEMLAAETVRGRSQSVEDASLRSMRAAFTNVDDTAVRARLAAQQGRQAEARALVEQCIEECVRAGRPGKSCHVAQIYAGIGEKDLAFRWLDKGVRGAKSPARLYEDDAVLRQSAFRHPFPGVAPSPRPGLMPTGTLP